MLQLSQITHSYHQGAQKLEILRGADLSVGAGEMAALVAPSGAGKSTLLHIAGLLETPDSGRIVIDGVEAAELSDKKRSRLRAEKIGFVYQFHHLLPEFSAEENIVLPQLLNGRGEAAALSHARGLLDKIGLGARRTHRPMELSGGEQQRVAILRALANDPKILLADEPTGNLDAATADSVFDMLSTLVRGQKMASLIVTHNTDLARRMDKVFTLHQGVIIPG